MFLIVFLLIQGEEEPVPPPFKPGPDDVTHVGWVKPQAGYHKKEMPGGKYEQLALDTPPPEEDGPGLFGGMFTLKGEADHGNPTKSEKSYKTDPSIPTPDASDEHAVQGEGFVKGRHAAAASGSTSPLPPAGKKSPGKKKKAKPPSSSSSSSSDGPEPDISEPVQHGIRRGSPAKRKVGFTKNPRPSR